MATATLKTYIICNIKKEHDRFLKIFSHVLLRGIDKDSVQFIAPNCEDNLDLEVVFKVYDPYLQRGQIPRFTSGTVSLKDISLVLNYVSVFQHADSTGLNDSAPILDLQGGVLIHREFLTRIAEFLKEESWDCIRLIDAPSAGALIFRLGFIRKLLKTILPFRESIEAELRFQVILHGATVLVASPSLAFQDSN